MYEPIFDEFTACEDDQIMFNADDDWDDDEPDEWEEALSECGRGQDYEGCMNAGSEYCEFECPFNR